MPSQDAISATPVTETTLLPKAMFALLGHTDAYKSVVDPIKRDRALRGKLRSVCRAVHKIIVEGHFNSDRHRWIFVGGNASSSDLEFPPRFQGIDAQLKKDKPVLASKSAKVFPGAFAAICIVAGDILSGYFDETQDEHEKLRSMCGLEPGEKIPPEQNLVLGMIAKRLRQISDQSTPDWAITYDQKRPVIRTDRERDFIAKKEARNISAIISGKYFLYRKAFLENPSGMSYLREYLSIIDHASGILFRLESKVGPEERESTITGVVICPDDAIWLIGHNSIPFRRLYTGSLSSQEMLRYCQSRESDDLFVRGYILGTKPAAAERTPEVRSFLLRSDYKGNQLGESFDNRARFINRDEVIRSVGLLGADFLDN